MSGGSAEQEDVTKSAEQSEDGEKKWWSSRERTYSISNPAMPWFGIDIGGTLVKLVYFEPTDQEEFSEGSLNGELQRVKHIHNYLASNKAYGKTGVRDSFLEMPKLIINGRHGSLHFIRFPTSRMHSFIQLTKTEGFAKLNSTVCATGGGAHKFEEHVNKELDLTFYKFDELESLIEGIEFVVKYNPEECYFWQHPLDEEKCQKVPWIPQNAQSLPYPYLVVNIGSGVSILAVYGDGNFKRVSGSSIAGGFFHGLCCLLTGCTTFEEALELATQGDNKTVDKLVKDIYGGDYQLFNLPGDTVASSVTIANGCSSQGQESYATGFKLLRGLLGCESFGGQGYPGVFMTDDSNAERGGLKEAWPESDQLLCQFHGPQAMWKWLWLGTHKIDNKDRQPLMQLYRDIMYAMDNESATTAYAKAMSTADVMGYPQFCHHLHSLWDSTDTVTQQPKRYLWCKAYRKGMTVGNETNNYAESNIRIFKDIILSRLKGYNPIALILLFCGKYEQYYRNRLLDFSNGRKPAAQFRINSLREKAAYLSDANRILRQSEAIFQVPSSNGNGSYDVNINHPSCTCPIGFTGAICKHQYAVSCLFDISPLMNVPKVSPKDCRDMATIAVGEENAPNASFYDFDNIESTTDENFAPMEVSSNVPAQTPKAHSVPSAWFIKEKVLEARQLLISNFSNAINSLALDNPSAHYAVKKLSRVLNKSTPSQVLTIIYGVCSKGGYKHDNNGHSIPVNEPATSRRLPDKSRSSKPAKKGRPPTSVVVCGATRSAAGKFPNGLARKRVLKCKRNLGDSIKKNRTNAKKHGENH